MFIFIWLHHEFSLNHCLLLCQSAVGMNNSAPNFGDRVTWISFWSAFLMWPFSGPIWNFAIGKHDTATTFLVVSSVSEIFSVTSWKRSPLLRTHVSTKTPVSCIYSLLLFIKQHTCKGSIQGVTLVSGLPSGGVFSRSGKKHTAGLVQAERLPSSKRIVYFRLRTNHLKCDGTLMSLDFQFVPMMQQPTCISLQGFIRIIQRLESESLFKCQVFPIENFAHFAPTSWAPFGHFHFLLFFPLLVQRRPWEFTVVKAQAPAKNQGILSSKRKIQVCTHPSISLLILSRLDWNASRRAEQESPFFCENNSLMAEFFGNSAQPWVGCMDKSRTCISHNHQWLDFARVPINSEWWKKSCTQASISDDWLGNVKTQNQVVRQRRTEGWS